MNVVLGERVTEWPDEPEKLNGKTKKVVTDKGSVFEADLVVSRSLFATSEVVFSPLHLRQTHT